MLRLVEATEIPRRAKYKTSIRRFLDEFARMDAKIVEVVGASEHYASVRSAQGNWSVSIKRAGYRMAAYSRGNRLYIEKLD